jgi:two-component SAPR family response regulator
MAKITIVDNDKTNISSITASLTPKGHTLSFLNTAAELMNSLQKKEPDLIIIAIELGKEDGRDLSKSLQLESVHKNVPVILTSPFYHTESEIRSYCCDDLVSLPFEEEQLSTSVEMLLAKEKAKAARSQTTIES